MISFLGKENDEMKAVNLTEKKEEKETAKTEYGGDRKTGEEKLQ